MKFCPDCNNYLYHKITNDTLKRECRNCGYNEIDVEGGKVMETVIQERTSESYKILLNEFTRQDPTLPHTKEIKCPNEGCPSNRGGTPRDVILIRYDAANLKYIYICNVGGCGHTWRSRS
jgi:DNA-directed RNA polymerase subunit M/transcription elongation factor TFIIS